eukprot:Rhum_TRINITY_DN13821_c1_g3::Rhum_TRINITY_DN13821_c1_g3_i1::g.64905::m.64905
MLHGLGTGGGSGGSPNPLQGLDGAAGSEACHDDLQNSARVEIDDVEADIRTPLSSPSLDPPAAGLGSPGVLSLSDVVMPAAAALARGGGGRTGGELRSAFPDSADGVGVEYDSDAIETASSSDGGGGAAADDDGAGGGGRRRSSKQVRFNPEMDVKMMSILSEDTGGFTSPGSSMSPARPDKAGTTTLTMEAPPPRNWDVEEVAGSTRYRKTSVSRENYRQLCRSTGRRATRTSGDYLKLHFLPGVFAAPKDAAPRDGGAAASGETEGFVDRDDGELVGLCAALSTSSASDDDDTAYHRDDDDDTASASTVDAAEVTDESDLEGVDGDAAAHAAQRRKAAAAASGVRRTKLQKRTERRTEEYAKLGLTPRRVLRDKGYNLAYMQGHWVTLMRQPLTVIGNVVHFWSTKEAVFFDTAVGLLRPKESTLSTLARDEDVGGVGGTPKTVACSFLDERVVPSKYSQHGDGSFRWKSATPPLPAKFSQAGRALLKGNRELFLKMYHVAWSDGDEWTRELDPLCTPILVETYDDAAYVKQHFANNKLPAPSTRYLKQKAVVKALHPTLPALVELHFINQSLNPGSPRGRQGTGDGDGDGDNQSDAAGHPRKDVGCVQWWPTCTIEPVLPPLHRSALQTKVAVLRGGPEEEAHGRTCCENLRPWRGKVFFALLFLLSVVPVIVLVVSV